MTRPTITPELLRELIEYCPETGALTWKPRGAHHFRDGRWGAEVVAAVWNEQHAGKPALSSPKGYGYLGGYVLGVPCIAHSVAYTIAHGVRPHSSILHLDGDRANNRLANMLVGSKAKRPSAAGASFQHGKWTASVTYAGKRQYLGRFRDRDEAIAASRAADARNRQISAEASR